MSENAALEVSPHFLRYVPWQLAVRCLQLWTVRMFVEEGARVAFADRDGDGDGRLEEELRAAGGDVQFAEAHMDREAEAAAFIEGVVARFGALHILVNNVAIRMYQTIPEASGESWDTILGVNVKSYAFCAKAAIPRVREAEGANIVNIASNNAFIAGINTPLLAGERHDPTLAEVFRTGNNSGGQVRRA